MLSIALKNLSFQSSLNRRGKVDKRGKVGIRRASNRMKIAMKVLSRKLQVVQVLITPKSASIEAKL